MAIKIPSKNIYSIKNPKIRDNAIDNITIGYNKVLPNNEYDTSVFIDEQSISRPPYSQNEPQENLVTTYIQKETNYHSVYGFSYIRLDCAYSTITSRVPIVAKNKYVSALTLHNDGDEKKGNYRVIGTIEKGTASAVASSKGVTVGTPEFSVSTFSTGSAPTYLEDVVLPIPTNETIFQDSVKIEYNGVERTENNELTFEDKVMDFSKVKTKNVTIDGVDYLETTFTYLTRFRVAKLQAINNDIFTQSSSTTLLSGEYEEYVPKKIEITFYGNTIGISTEDNTMTIGIGTKPLKIDGNELLQNIDDIKQKYEKPLEDYGNGKETATVLCTMSDYYDYNNGQKVISPNGTNILDGNYVELWNANYNKNDGKVSQNTADNATDYLFQLQGIKDGEFTIDSIDRKTIYSSGNISLRFTKSNDFSQIRFKLNGKTIDTGISFDVSDLENGKTYFFHANVNIDGGQGSVYWNEMQITRQARVKGYDKYGLPMAFQLYDEVVPMVMRYDGKDYPLSVDASGNAKVFKVLGINIYFDGAIWQELSLQEC